MVTQSSTRCLDLSTRDDWCGREALADHDDCSSLVLVDGVYLHVFFFFSSRRRHTRFDCDWSSDVCSSDLGFNTRGIPMSKHFSEAELLETYYTQPGESMPVMMHLASCGECAARYERLEAKLRGLAACDVDQKPQTFWTRQRMLIMRGIDARTRHGRSAARTWRVAAP